MHYPTDVSLLWDAMRCVLRETGRAAGDHAVGGWRQWRHLAKEVKKLFNQVRSTRRAKRHPERVEAYLARCRALVARTMETLDELRDKGVEETTCQSIQGFIAHAQRQLGQVERRLLRGEAIAHEKKVFSVFEEHTRWISKGKAGTPVKLGVPVALIEDQHQFILHHKILWEGEDVDVAAPMVSEAQARYPELRACSFDRGFHSPDNRIKLDALLDLNVLPTKGYLSRADREREAEEPFAAARRAHPAIESAINGLEHRGLDRVHAMARTASRAPSHCRYWPPTCIASGCSCKSASANDDDSPPDRPLPLKHAVTRPAERREAPHPWKPDVRADFLPALPAGRQASPSRPVSWSKSYPRWAGLVADFRPQGGFLADTNYR